MIGVFPDSFGGVIRYQPIEWQWKTQRTQKRCGTIMKSIFVAQRLPLMYLLQHNVLMNWAWSHWVRLWLKRWLFLAVSGAGAVGLGQKCCRGPTTCRCEVWSESWCHHTHTGWEFTSITLLFQWLILIIYTTVQMFRVGGGGHRCSVSSGENMLVSQEQSFVYSKGKPVSSWLISNSSRHFSLQILILYF